MSMVCLAALWIGLSQPKSTSLPQQENWGFLFRVTERASKWRYLSIPTRLANQKQELGNTILKLDGLNWSERSSAGMPRSFKYDSGDGVVDEFLNVPDDVSDEDYIAKMQLNSAEEKEITLFNKIDDTADSKEVFQEAYEFTRRHEGGFSNEKYDSPTQFGIAKRYWPEEHEKVRQMVISGDAVGAEAYTRNFYKKNFWDAVGADKLQRKDAVLMFDTAVLFSP